MSKGKAVTPAEVLIKVMEEGFDKEQLQAAEALLPYAHKGTKDATNPDHYKRYPVECIQLTEHMNFCLGNAVKYIYRAGEKDDIVQDLRKAIWYINREIERIQHGANNTNGITGNPLYGKSPSRVSESLELVRAAAVRELSEENVLRKDSEGAGTQSASAGKGDQNPRNLGELLKERINELDSRDRKSGGPAKRVTITRRNRGA
jgi:hypothetical protein